MNKPVAELVLEQMAVGDASSLRVNWLTDSYPPVGTQLYTHPVKQLSDEDLKLLEKVINDCAGNIEYRIDVERLAFKGYEHCSELESLYEEQKDANRALAIIKEITE